MAGDWIKVQNVTPNKPEVFVIADALGIDPDAVVGKLVRVWIWADEQTTDGNALSVTQSLLDRIAGVSGFADAMVQAQWLKHQSGMFTFPNFNRHNGKTAKARALASKRVESHRSKKCNAASVTKALPEKRREESMSLPEGKDIHEAQNTHMQAVVDAWNMLGFQRCRSLTPKRQKSIKARWRVAAWRDSWKQAIERIRESSFCAGGGKDGWIADIDWFLRPDTVTNILEGKYDNRTTHGRTGAGQGNSVSPEQARQDASVAALLAFRDSGRVSEGDAGPRRLEENGGIHQGAS